jgi:hypothetical protein
LTEGEPKPKRRRPTNIEKLSLKAAEVALFLHQYGPRAQKGTERRYVMSHNHPFPTPHHVVIFEGNRLIKLRRFNTAEQAENFRKKEEERPMPTEPKGKK